MEKSSQIAWKIVPLKHFFPLKVVPLIEVLLYINNMVFCVKDWPNPMILGHTLIAAEGNLLHLHIAKKGARELQNCHEL
jgi:hypothetical protein